jgi:predicted lipid-binding transport protein (Tim44 family)
MRGLAGGVAGGFLGSMLFSSMGNAFGGGAGLGGGGGGGIGLIEIVLIGAAAFFGYRWFRNRQQQNLATAGGPALGAMNRGFEQTDSRSALPSTWEPQAVALTLEKPTEEEVTDMFFKLQGAWTRRDLLSAQPLLGNEMKTILQSDVDDLLTQKRINRLENISMRKVMLGEPWAEGNETLVTARFSANLLDYTVDEQTGQVVSGDATTPVKFEEDWTFAKMGSDGTWKIAGIQQV